MAHGPRSAEDRKAQAWASGNARDIYDAINPAWRWGAKLASIDEKPEDFGPGGRYYDRAQAVMGEISWDEVTSQKGDPILRPSTKAAQEQQQQESQNPPQAPVNNDPGQQPGGQPFDGQGGFNPGMAGYNPGDLGSVFANVYAQPGAYGQGYPGAGAPYGGYGSFGGYPGMQGGGKGGGKGGGLGMDYYQSNNIQNRYGAPDTPPPTMDMTSEQWQNMSGDHKQRYWENYNNMSQTPAPGMDAPSFDPYDPNKEYEKSGNGWYAQDGYIIDAQGNVQKDEPMGITDPGWVTRYDPSKQFAHLEEQTAGMKENWQRPAYWDQPQMQGPTSLPSGYGQSPGKGGGKGGATSQPNNAAQQQGYTGTGKGGSGKGGSGGGGKGGASQPPTSATGFGRRGGYGG